MSTNRDIKLQVALDFVELPRAIAVAGAAVAGGADIIKLGGGNRNRPAMWHPGCSRANCLFHVAGPAGSMGAGESRLIVRKGRADGPGSH